MEAQDFELASGDLVWVAESDDYCSVNLVAALVKHFVNEAVMLAYCRTTFVDKDSAETGLEPGGISSRGGFRLMA